MSLAIGVDVGGTKIAAGVVDETGTVLAQIRRATPAREADRIAATIAELAAELGSAYGATSIGIGAAGLVDDDRSTVLFAPNLAWRNEPLGQRVGQATGLRTVVENDANAAGWGEARFGAAQGASSAVILTVGTGIGGAVILDGRLVRGAHGLASEWGHMVVRPEGRRCGCGLRGCWERYASGTALVADARELATVDPARAAQLLALAGGRPDRITGMHVTAAARAGDPAAVECLDNLGVWLGRGMASLAAVLDPDVVVLAGGVSEAGELLRRPAEESFGSLLAARSFRPQPAVRLATQGNLAGLVGAADLSRSVSL